MAPPFIAYYGILQGGSQETALLQEAYNQCKLYRSYLHDDSGLWKHIVLGDTASQDFRHWGTGMRIDHVGFFAAEHVCRKCLGSSWYDACPPDNPPLQSGQVLRV